MASVLARASRVSLAPARTKKRTEAFRPGKCLSTPQKTPNSSSAALEKAGQTPVERGRRGAPTSTHTLRSPANVNFEVQGPQDPLDHRESSRFSTQKFAFWTSGLKDKADWKRTPFGVLGWANRSAAVWRPRASLRKPRRASGSRVSRVTSRFARRRGSYLSACSPRRLPASASAARTPTRPAGRPPRLRFPPLVRGPRRRAQAQRRPTEGRPATGRRAGSALHFLVERLDARSRQPPRRRSENARASLRAPPPGPMKGGACWGVPSLHDDRRPLRGCWPLYFKRFTVLGTRRCLSWQEVRA